MKLPSLKMISNKRLLCVFLCLLVIVIDANARSTTASLNAQKAVTTQPTTVLTTIGPPDKVEQVRVTDRNENSISLSWDKVSSISTYFLKYEHNGAKEIFIDETDGTTISYVVTPLTAGTKYSFTVITTLDGRNSTGTTTETSTRPRNAENFQAIGQNDTSITLQWNKVENNKYTLRYGSEEENFTTSEETVVRRSISSLTAMTEYDFRLFTVFEADESSGVNVIAYTAPPKPAGLQTVGQDETSITLQWDKVGDLLKYILSYGGTEVEVSAEAGPAPVTKKIEKLTAATSYDFRLFAVFNGVRSSGLDHSAVTAPRDASQLESVDRDETSITLQWQKVENVLQYRVVFNGSEKPFSAPEGQDPVIYKASGLTTATRYEFVLFSVFENIKSRGVNFTAVTAPRNSDDFRLVGQNETSITLEWTKMNDFTYTLEYDGKETNISASDERQVTVPDLTNTTKYNFTLFTVFEEVKSSGVSITAATAPPNAEDVTATEQKETSIALQWKKVGAILDYRLEYNSQLITVRASAGEEAVTKQVTGLESGTRYVFSVFALFENISSSGREFPTSTAPSRVASVTVADRLVDSVTLEWKNARGDWSYTLHINGEDLPIPNPSEGVVTKVVSSLKPGTEYPFSVITSFDGVQSAAFTGSTITTIDCANAFWDVTNSSIKAMIEGLFTNATASNRSQTHVSHGGLLLLFTGLYPGATYEVSLEYENNSEPLNQCRHTVTIKPPNLEAYCEYWGQGYSVYVGWNKPAGIWTEVEVKVDGVVKTHDGEQHAVIPGFQPAKTHKISVASVSGTQKSAEYVFSCQTDPRGVIAGSIMGVLIFLGLVCLAAFVLLKRPDLIRRNKPFIGGKNNKKPKAIPVEKFSDHFYQLGMDENRGFSQEYENLKPVGTEQTHRDALLPENKPKNRFNNVLPYDWCRVTLTSSDANGTSDYINANYMPGFKSSREYIATQGPLPSTVNDFWRMIWEQRVKGIVMVTNCRESGKTKCEQYWPEDTKSTPYDELTVTVRSEQKEPNWTLREFVLKHINYSAERTVKHFHFTAWPDHGVPQGTHYLIQFRGLVRQHIDRDGNGAPTVVHCSAGVGRTGTIIALDVLLQQLEKERAVGINGFVHNMRLNRPHMVQTESQYVFLHQCIIDTLQQKEISDENIYENGDMLYVNATALKEFHKGSQV